MAVYKVLQDIEAEDKLLGPLTLKGFIYVLIAGFLAFINFRLLITPGLGVFRWLLILIFGLPMLLFVVLASPLGREQPTEVWLLSRLRFFIKPKGRIWDQTGVSQLVTITAPKKIDQHLTKDLTQTEVQSRLKALATEMDTRGWTAIEDSDRLVGASSIPQEVQLVDVHPADDILDEQNSPIAQLFAGLMQKKDAQRKKELAGKIEKAKDGQPTEPKASPAGRQAGQPAYHIPEDEIELNRKFAAAEASLHSQHQQGTSVTEIPQAAKLELAQSGNDLSVASISKLANRQPRVKQAGPNEVEVSLH